ncbi:glycerol-3-phosphate ABC transporter, substrate-binding protein [Escherichia coli]|nr:glycerol-3-phosphate ABC transporter, substrate-binding protein [Escherichia coli]
MGNAQAVTTIPFWHSMEGELGKEVDSLAQRFNAENPDYKIVPTYKGNYEQNLSAGIAAFRTGNAPAILQVYEVGTATMMASKAIKPVYDVFKEAGIQFDESQFVPTVSGYYSDSKTGHLLSQPFNSSTPVLYYNKDAFKKAGLDPETAAENLAGSGGLFCKTESLRNEVRLRQRLAGLDPTGKL